MKTLLKAVGYLLLALVVLIAGYLFVFSRSFHIPVNLYAPAAYVPPAARSSCSAAIAPRASRS